MITPGRRRIRQASKPSWKKKKWDGGERAPSALIWWCYFVKHAASLDSDHLPAVLHSPAVERALDVLNVISKTDLERERYLAAERWERDHRMYVRNAENAEKKAENAEKKGMVDRIQRCQRFLKVKLTDDADLYALSIQELESRVKTWEDQLLAKS